MLENPDQTRLRIDRIEEIVGAYNDRFETIEAETQQITEEQARAQLQAGQQNFMPNGDFDYTRNRYYYLVDYVSTDGRVDADVSEEAAFWFVAARDTAKEHFTGGAITSADNTLTIPGGGDVIAVGDVGNEIVVYGAGTAGANLVTTIASRTSDTECELTLAAGTTVTNARVRWNLQELKEDSTDVDYEAGETALSLVGDIASDAVRHVSANYTIGTVNGAMVTILGDATGAGITITLPPADKAYGQVVNVKKIDASVNKVAIDGNGAETIDNSGTAIDITTQYQSRTVISDGAEWWVID